MLMRVRMLRGPVRVRGSVLAGRMVGFAIAVVGAGVRVRGARAGPGRTGAGAVWTGAAWTEAAWVGAAWARRRRVGVGPTGAGSGVEADATIRAVGAALGAVGGAIHAACAAAIDAARSASAADFTAASIKGCGFQSGSKGPPEIRLACMDVNSMRSFVRGRLPSGLGGTSERRSSRNDCPLFTPRSAYC